MVMHREVQATACGEGRPFERIRRITGYLAGSLERFNNAKRAEEGDRVKHGVPVGAGAEGGGGRQRGR